MKRQSSYHSESMVVDNYDPGWYFGGIFVIKLNLPVRLGKALAGFGVGETSLFLLPWV